MNPPSVEGGRLFLSNSSHLKAVSWITDMGGGGGMVLTGYLLMHELYMVFPIPIPVSISVS